jgi:hypothetical protein
MDARSGIGDWLGRLIQMTLALYLIPALVIVLVVGSVGILVLTVGRLFLGPIPKSIG